ncbi:MAG: hypothetical protein ACP5R4_10930 [Armatimonadota bacterium]
MHAFAFRTMKSPVLRIPKQFGALSLAAVAVMLSAHTAFAAGSREDRVPSLTELAPPVPSSQNAAPIYLRAFQLCPKDRNASQLLSSFISSDGANAKAIVPKVRAALQKYEKALSLARRAASMPHCRFPTNWQTADPAALRSPYYADLRELARATAAHAKLCAMDGRAHEAAADLQASFRMAKHVGEDPVLISVLVEYACIGIAGRALLGVLETSILSEKDIKKLDQTLAEMNLNGALVRALQGELALSMQTLRNTSSKQTSESICPGGG